MNFVTIDIPRILTYLEQIYTQQHPGIGWNVIYVMDNSPDNVWRIDANKFFVFKSFDQPYHKMKEYPKFTLLWAKILQDSIDDGAY